MYAAIRCRRYSEKCDDDDSANSILTQTVWVKYVRRELQSLTDDDREEFLDALHTLWEVNTVDGKVIVLALSWEMFSGSAINIHDMRCKQSSMQIAVNLVST